MEKGSKKLTCKINIFDCFSDRMNCLSCKYIVLLLPERDLCMGLGITDRATEARQGSVLCELLWWL